MPGSVAPASRAGGRAVIPRTVYIVLPAYNEASSVSAVLESLEKAAVENGLACHAVVVNDGSADSTGDIVRKRRGTLPLTLIEHPRNLGLGAAIRSGLLRAVDLAGGDDVIVTMDADDTHTAAAIAPMLERIDQGFDVLIASRYRPGARVLGVPPFRRFLSRAASVIFQVVFPTPGVRDFTCGYRAYRATVLRDAVLRYRQEFIDQEGFQCMVDILLKLRRMRLRFGEVPLVLRYDRKAGKSKMKILRTIVKTLALLCRRRIGL
jgi:dolichol-phosphate mannosyltransferase